jgi:hypothetical protein
MQGSSVGATSRQQQRKHTEGLGAAAYMCGGWQRRGWTVVCRRVIRAVRVDEREWVIQPDNQR